VYAPVQRNLDFPTSETRIMFAVPFGQANACLDKSGLSTMFLRRLVQRNLHMFAHCSLLFLCGEAKCVQVYCAVYKIIFYAVFEKLKGNSDCHNDSDVNFKALLLLLLL
jgi:hypothetical protein